MTRARILNVDDSTARLYVTSRYLRHAGFEVAEATTAAAAWIALRESPPDLVVLDVHLPDGNGVEICSEMRRDDRLRRIPVLMLSAKSVSGSDRAFGLNSGADGYLVEPVEGEEIVAAVAALLRMKSAETALRISEGRYRTLLDAIPQLVWSAGPDGVIASANARWTEYTGFAADQSATTSWFELVDPEQVHEVTAGWMAAMAAGETYEGRFRLRGADGTYRWFLARAVPQFGDEDHVVQWFGTFTDVDEQVRQEEAVRLSEERFRRLVNADIIGIIQGASDGSVAEANDAFLTMVGLSRTLCKQGLVNWRDVTPAEYHALDDAALAESEARGSCTPYEKEFLRSDGLRVPVLVGHARLPGRGDQHIAFTLDLTAQKEAERREREAREIAERASHAKDEFFATLSHELRTPMTAIMGWASMLEMGLAEGDTQELALRSLNESARLQARLIDDLLDITRAASGKLLVDQEPVDLLAVVDSTVESLRLAAESRELCVVVHHETSVARVRGDERRLHQITSNLLSNAIKFTPRGGRVDVRVGESGDDVVLSVRDTGKGISPEFLPRVFEWFAQQDFGSNRQHEGLGLGLAIVRDLVALHGGHIEARSEGAGRGAEFTVHLPRHLSGTSASEG